MICPYLVSGPVTTPNFYGRSQLLAEIAAGRQRAFYILGTRQIGKTSLLHQLNSQLPALYLDVQWAGGYLSDLVGQVQWDLTRKIEQYPWLPAPDTISTEDLFALLRTINLYAEKAGQTLWLLVDEAEGLLATSRTDPVILHRLRGTIQNCPHLCTVFVAAKTLSEANKISATEGLSPFLNGFILRYLSGLTRDETIELLRQCYTPVPVEVSDEVANSLFDLTNGHPLILQLLAERLFDRGSLRLPNEDDIVSVNDTLDRLGLFSTDFSYLTDKERLVLQSILENGSISAEINPVYLHSLAQLGYVRGSRDNYAIGNAFFTNWLRHQSPWGEVSRVSEEATLNLYQERRSSSEYNKYNVPIIRRWLTEAFSDEDFTVFCYDHFRSIYQKFTGEMTRQKKIQLLVDYCDRNVESGKVIPVAH